jgi:hypothetical protein
VNAKSVSRAGETGEMKRCGREKEREGRKEKRLVSEARKISKQAN